MKFNIEGFNSFPPITVKATVGCIIEKDNKVLITKRNTRTQFGKWCVPGGHIEIGEIALKAAMREVKEETGLDVEDVKFFNYYDEFFPKNKFHAVTLIFSGKAKGKEEESGEVLDRKWIEKKDLEKYDFAFHHKKILMDYFRRKK